MKEHFGNTPSEMLNLLVDGELNAAQETALYSQLAINDELRNEFRELLAIKESVHMDTEAFSPPMNSLSNIISTIGFNVSNISLNNTKINTLKSKIIKRLVIPALTIIITALITTLIVNNYYESQYQYSGNYIPLISSFSLDDNNISINEALIKNKNSATRIINNHLLNKKIENKNNSNLVKFNNSIDNKIIHTKENINDNIITDPINNEQKSLSEINYSNMFSFPKSNLYIPNDDTYFNVFHLQNISNHKKSSGIGYSIHLRGLSLQSFPNIDIPSQTKTVLNNIAFGGFLSESMHHKLGFELGQEPFGQRFSNIDENTKVPKEYEQNPILFWAGLSYRYEYDRLDFLGGFQPFGQVTIGSTELGPLGRAILGLQYFNDSGVGFSLGIEGVLLLYENQKTIYTTKKLGFTYGMFLNL